MLLVPCVTLLLLISSLDFRIYLFFVKSKDIRILMNLFAKKKKKKTFTENLTKKRHASKDKHKSLKEL